MQVILNKKEKEELVAKLHQENKTIRQIAEVAHVSKISATLERCISDDMIEGQVKNVKQCSYLKAEKNQLTWQ